MISLWVTVRGSEGGDLVNGAVDLSRSNRTCSYLVVGIGGRL